MKPEGTLDMFSSGVADSLKKEKAKPAPPMSRDMQIAHVSGIIAGLPQQLAIASEALEDAEIRCQRARAVAGILTQLQAERVKGIQEQLAAWRPELERIQKDVAGLVAAGVGLPEKPAVPRATNPPPYGIRATGGPIREVEL